jgi:hypothetical protein
VKQRVFAFVAALSLAVCFCTALFWLKRAVRSEFHFGGPVRLYGRSAHSHEELPHFRLRADDGYEFYSFHSWPVVRGPEYLTPEFQTWERQFKRRNRVVDSLGFHFSYWAIMRHPGQGFGKPGDPTKLYTEFTGYDVRATVPFWFILVSSSILPLV